MRGLRKGTGKHAPRHRREAQGHLNECREVVSLRKQLGDMQRKVEQGSQERQGERLEMELKEAEERGRRAQSMAEQTKAGHVYIISNIGSFGKDVYKIGLTRRLEPEIRVRELGDASVPFAFDIHGMIYSENAPELESSFHKHFRDRQVNLVNARKEFFAVGLDEIEEFARRNGVRTKLTKAAEAKEYRETVAMRAGMTNAANCQMLCKDDNRRKSGR